MDWHIEFCCKEEDSEDFIESTQAASIYLAIVQGGCLEELFEHDTILAMLAGSHLDIVLA